MKSIFCLVALLFMCLTVSNVSAQVGNEKLHLLVEYFMPYWRQHRARLRPFTFAQPVPLWRVARGVEEQNVDAVKTEDKKDLSPEENDYVGCLYYKSKLLCERIANDRRTNERVECEVRKNFKNPALENFVSFSISDKRTDGKSERFNLFPKRPATMDLAVDELKGTRMSLNWIGDSDDEGFSFTHKECWVRMNDFLSKIKPTTVRVKKINSKEEKRGSENVIGNLIQIDFGL